MLAYSQEMNDLQLLKNDDNNDDDDTDYNYDQDSSNNGGRYDIFQTIISNDSFLIGLMHGTTRSLSITYYIVSKLSCHHKADLWNAWINI